MIWAISLTHIFIPYYMSPIIYKMAHISVSYLFLVNLNSGFTDNRCEKLAFITTNLFVCLRIIYRHFFTVFLIFRSYSLRAWFSSAISFASKSIPDKCVVLVLIFNSSKSDLLIAGVPLFWCLAKSFVCRFVSWTTLWILFPCLSLKLKDSVVW